MLNRRTTRCRPGHADDRDRIRADLAAGVEISESDWLLLLHADPVAAGIARYTARKALRQYRAIVHAQV